MTRLYGECSIAIEIRATYEYGGFEGKVVAVGCCGCCGSVDVGDRSSGDPKEVTVLLLMSPECTTPLFLNIYKYVY